MNEMKHIHFPPPVADEMVRAIQAGRKTVTRRVMKPQPIDLSNNQLGTRLCLPPYPYHPGDILYVRETWNYGYCDTTDFEACCNETFFEELTPGTYKDSFLTPRYFYKTEDLDGIVGMKWHPSIHMPREAARIFLRVTDVRVERLMDITGKQARAEGFTNRGAFLKEFLAMYPDCTPESWLWAIAFERVSREEAVP